MRRAAKSSIGRGGRSMPRGTNLRQPPGGFASKYRRRAKSVVSRSSTTSIGTPSLASRGCTTAAWVPPPKATARSECRPANSRKRSSRPSVGTIPSSSGAEPSAVTTAYPHFRVPGSMPRIGPVSATGYFGFRLSVNETGMPPVCGKTSDAAWAII
jgi:hypothetical protein